MKVGVLGAGTMGHGIAQVTAMAGHDVVMRDIEEEFVENGIESIEANLQGGVERDKVSEAEKEAALGRISGTTDLEAAVTDADMVVERSRVALHYDGGHHRTPEQQRRDARRDRLWQEAGHLSITVMGADLAEDFRTVVAAVVRHDRAVRATSTTSGPAPAAGLSNVKSGEWALSNVG